VLGGRLLRSLLQANSRIPTSRFQKSWAVGQRRFPNSEFQKSAAKRVCSSLLEKIEIDQIAMRPITIWSKI
jgi:hypothetical protein